MTTGLSLRTRAILAVALLIGFYGLALAIAGGLLWIPYAEWRYAERIHFKILIFCVIGAYLILKAIVPRRERFESPGPLLKRAEHPRLFALVDDVARATGQQPPAEVYLVPEVNAWVMERDTRMGFGGRRVMGVGLPLLEILSVAEFRAVIAHEFGHYVAGDTALGPVIYRTHAAIGRTLDEVSSHSSWLAKPFEWYGKAFLRVTHAISRAQEFVADATAAAVGGRDAMKRALVNVAGGATAYGGYWRSELAPALSHGFRPPAAAGFRQFLAAPSVAPHVARLVDEELASDRTDPYDTHPNLRDRIGALDRLTTSSPSGASAAGDDDPATTLLGDLDRAEHELYARMTETGELTPLSWEELPLVVLPRGWRETVGGDGVRLGGMTPERLPALVPDLPALAAALGLASSPTAASDEDVSRAESLVGCALSLALLSRTSMDGAALRLEAPPGEPVRFVAGEHAILPFAVCEQLASGVLRAEEWAALCTQTGIEGIDLAAVARGPVPQYSPMQATRTRELTDA